MPTKTNRRRPGPEDTRLWHLAAGVALGTDPYELELELNHLAVRVARTQCGRLAHRGAMCHCRLNADGGDAPIASSPFAGIVEIVTTRWARDGKRTRVSGIRGWLQSGATDAFLAFDGRVLAKGRPAECLERWNVDRQLPAKAVTLLHRLRGPVLQELADQIRLLDLTEDDWDHLSARLPHAVVPGCPDGLRSIQDPRLWVEALYLDATQPATDEVDVDRIVRSITWTGTKSKRSRSASATDEASSDDVRRRDELAGRVARGIDLLLALHVPEVHDYLGRARTQTRTTAELQDDRDASSWDDDAEGWSDLDG